MAETGRDRLRELLDAVLDDDNGRLHEMADDAFASPFHFSRVLSVRVGEPPVALRRRVLLERAAWQLSGGASVTEVAFAVGYESVDGFARAYARAFGHPPSATTSGSAHRLPAPNGIHFHPPTHLWLDAADAAPVTDGGALAATLVHHDIADTAALIEAAGRLPDGEYRRARVPGLTVLPWDGPEESIAAVLERLVWAKEVWVASVAGDDFPRRGRDDPEALRSRHEVVGDRWVGLVRGIGARGAWSDSIVDALCEPPQSFALGGIVVRVVTYAAHRRQLVRAWLREAGQEVGPGDPLEWLAGHPGKD